MAEQAQMPAGAPSLKGMAPSLIVDAVLPALTYQILTRHGVSQVAALSIGAIFPAANVVRGIVTTRRADLIGVLVLIFIAIGVATSMISGNVLFVLIKESFLTGTFGLVFLGSLLTSRPLIFYLGRQIAAGDDAARIEQWNQRWEVPGFRRTLRIMTAVWGIGLVAEAAVRVVLALTLRPATVITISPVMGIGATVALIIWTRTYARIAQERARRVAGMSI